MVNLEKLSDEELSAYFDAMEASSDADLRMLRLNRSGVVAHLNYLATKKRRAEVDRFVKYMIKQIESKNIPLESEYTPRVFALWGARIDIDRELMRYDGFMFYCYAVLMLVLCAIVFAYIVFVAIH